MTATACKDLALHEKENLKLFGRTILVNKINGRIEGKLTSSLMEALLFESRNLAKGIYMVIYLKKNLHPETHFEKLTQDNNKN